MFTSIPKNPNKGIMVLCLVEAQEVLCGEVFPTFDAAVDVCFAVVDFIIIKGVKREVWTVSW
jgi:hypothetical protein